MSSIQANARRGRTLQVWTPEDKAFWEREGEAIAKLNLWISVPALFLAFAASFLLLGAMQALLTLGGFATEERSWLYLVRLTAFLLILAALWWQNRRKVGSR